MIKNMNINIKKCLLFLFMKSRHFRSVSICGSTGFHCNGKSTPAMGVLGDVKFPSMDFGNFVNKGES